MDRLNNLLFENRDNLTEEEIVDALLSTDFEIPAGSDLDTDDEADDIQSDGVLQRESVSCAKIRSCIDQVDDQCVSDNVEIVSVAKKLDVVAEQVTEFDNQTVSTDTISTSPSLFSDINNPRPSTSAQAFDINQSVQVTDNTIISPGQSSSLSNQTYLTHGTKNKPVALKPLWLVKNLDYQQDKSFLGNATLPQHILDLQTPFQFFNYFIDDNIIQRICEETLAYSVQKNPNKPYELTPTNLRRYLGILIMMSIVKLNNIRSYWSPNIGNKIISDCMTVNKFEEIRRFLHFNDLSKMKPQGDPEHDRLFRIRPIIIHLQEKFNSIPPESELSIDEQICATKIRHYMKQYNPMKPHKWGFKIFVLSGVSGFAYNFEIFSGAEPKMLPDEPNLGACANVVIRLSRIIPCNMSYKLYFDNWYTTLALLVHLEKKKIHPLGTVRKNRFPGLKFPEEKNIRKEPRGTSVENVASVDGVDVAVVQWLDNKVVTIASTFVGCNPIGQCKRYDRKLKSKVDIPRPKIIEEYVKFMGGVDLLDSILAQHKISMKSKKWYFRIFYHLVDLTVVNSWLLYRRVHGDTMTQTKFREELSVTLCLLGNNSTPKRGRPSNNAVENLLDAKRKKGPAIKPPPKDIRLDSTNHWPVWNKDRLRCKLPGCKGYSYVKCEKCQFTLCLNKDRNCFHTFHTN